MKVFQSLILILAFSGLITGCGSTPEPTQASQAVTLYYYGPGMDMDAQGNVLCSAAGLAAVPHELPVDLDGVALIRATLERLLAGDLSVGEVAEGITSEFPLNGVVLEDVALEDGLLTLTFSDPGFETSGGACRVSILRAQVDATALQFDRVDEVRILPEELFQP